MQSDRDSGLGDLEAQLASKEREWKELLAARVHQLESLLKKAQEECSSLRYHKLSEDFQFNLAILDERDRELERYDVITARAVNAERHRYNSSLFRASSVQIHRRYSFCVTSMAGEIQRQTEEYERMKWDLQHKIQELEGELTLQRQEMTAAFDSELRQQEHEFNLKMDEMRAVVLSHDLKVRRQLSKETEVHYQAQLQATEALKVSKEFCQQIETQLQHKEQEIKDLTVETTRTGWDKYISQVSSEMVVKDTEVITLQERETKLKTELDRIKEEMEGYKQQLSAGLKRERALEQKRVQVELEWQRRCEDLKAELYLANEQLIQDLSNARDQVTELKEKEQELQELTVLLRSVKTERDQRATTCGISANDLSQNVLSDDMDHPSEEIRRLQEQNSTLRAVVTQMRKDMEGLSRLLPQPQPQASSLQPVWTALFYTNMALEQEVSQLKARCRHLEEKLEGPIGLPSLAPEDLLPTVPHNTRLQYQGLKQGGLCLENRANTSALMRLEARVTHVIEQVQKVISKPFYQLGQMCEMLGRYCVSCCSNPLPSTLISYSFQNAQLREENLYLQQQQASGQMSVGLFEDVQGAKSNPRLLHTRLKQAASCIARLSREKQQLIEMGNRLRAQITTAGLEVPQNSVCLTEAVEPERDSSTEKLGEQHDRLSALEQLQYQLTSQVSASLTNKLLLLPF
uniref:Coiled-coil domain containing 57 n=1 Tax=Dicentrarchus labrax TaxID=13489 RepID=A0A8C4H5W8_DICLA